MASESQRELAAYRQQRALAMWLQGAAVRDIADILGISMHRVNEYLKNDRSVKVCARVAQIQSITPERIANASNRLRKGDKVVIGQVKPKAWQSDSRPVTGRVRGIYRNIVEVEFENGKREAYTWQEIMAAGIV